MSIYKKILEVQKAVGRVAKNGFNAFHKYNYATEMDIMEAVRATALEQGLLIMPLTVEEETGVLPDGKRFAKVRIAYILQDADAQMDTEGYLERVCPEYVGYAEDNNDKALYKAITGANKYFYMKFFGIATGDDPEKEEQPAKPGKGNKPYPVQAAGEESPLQRAKREFEESQRAKGAM